MSTVLRPKGVPIILGEEERNLLFTLNAIDEIQTHYDKTIGEVFVLMSQPETAVNTMRYVASALLTDEAEWAKFRDPDSKLRPIGEKEAGWLITRDNYEDVAKAIIEAYRFSMPEADEDDPNVESEQMNS